MESKYYNFCLSFYATTGNFEDVELSKCLYSLKIVVLLASPWKLSRACVIATVMNVADFYII